MPLPDHVLRHSLDHLDQRLLVAGGGGEHDQAMDAEVLEALRGVAVDPRERAVAAAARRDTDLEVFELAAVLRARGAEAVEAVLRRVEIGGEAVPTLRETRGAIERFGRV